MRKEIQSPALNSNNKKVSSQKISKKSNVTLSIDDEILSTLKSIAEAEGLSINSKMNSILWRFIYFYRYVEQDSSMVIPTRSVNFLIENIDEEKWMEEYSHALDEIVPFFFLDLNIIPTLDETLKFVFERLLIYAGSYKGYSSHVDDNGYLILVFRHEYGIKWSRILSAVYIQFIEKTLDHSARSLNVTDGWFAIKISKYDRSVNDDDIVGIIK